MKLFIQSLRLGQHCPGLLLALLLLAICSLKMTLAYGEINHTIPLSANNRPSFSTQSGLQVKVRSSWGGSLGYWPFQLQISSRTAATADRQITIRFTASRRRNQVFPITVEQDFELAQGDSNVSIRLLVPRLIDWNRYGWEVWVDGIPDMQLSLFSQPFNSTIDKTSLAIYLPNRAERIEIGKGLVGLVDRSSLTIALGDSELLDTWLSYSTFGVVAATPEELAGWKAESQDRFEELLRWIRVGGNLWITGSGDERARILEVERALSISGGEQSSDDPAPGWHYLPLHGNSTTGVDGLLKLKSPVSYETSSQSWLRSRDSTDPTTAVDSHNWFVTKAFGMGTITVFRSSRSMGSANAIEAVDRSLLANRVAWVPRHGNDPSRGNREFNNFLIPEVGIAPVFEFQVLISLFVIGIGPVNYWLLKRRGQLPLLLVTVPAAALATTLVLFAYGLLSEGISTRVRARSFTMLDQPAGEAACWARLSYYAGVAPAEGLRMPADVAVYPILSSFSGGNRFAQSRELLWDDASVELRQNLSQGWLAARTPTQYQTITARPTNKRIEFEPTDEGLRVTNQLGVDVNTLAVQDDKGRFYLSEKIAAGESILLPKSNKVKATMAIRKLLAAHDPQFPAGAEVAARRRRSMEALSQNLMENELAAITSPVVQGWGSRSYIAITAQGVELNLGLETVIEQDSCHVIRGSW